MEWYEILVIVLAACFVAGIVIWQIIRKKQGKNGCDCSCGCGNCAGCPTVKDEKPKK